jgi:hypothetical protein
LSVQGHRTLNGQSLALAVYFVARVN